MEQEPTVGILNKYPKLTGILDRAVLVGLTYLASKGYITNADIANFAPLAPLALAAIIGAWQNRKLALAQKATTIAPGTVVVTSPEVAKATPNNANIVSNEIKEVVSK